MPAVVNAFSDRCRGLLPGRRAGARRCRAIAGRPGNIGSSATPSVILDLLRRARRPRHVLHSRLVRRALARARRSASPRRATRWPAMGSRTSSSTRRREAVFREETRRSKQFLEDTIGAPVTGYRAASFSITSESLWALDVLIDLGFEYDSSVFPIRHDRYGIPGAAREPGAGQRALGTHDRGVSDVRRVVRRRARAGVRRRLLPPAAVCRDAAGL